METEKRLIDAYKLEELLRSNSGRYHHKDDVIAAIAGQPTVDAVEVVHGRWVNPYINRYGHPCHCCSECGFKASYQDKNYCPDCGAKMDGDGNG